LGAGGRDDRRVFSPPPSLAVSALASVLALRPKHKIVVVQKIKGEKVCKITTF